MNEQPPAIAPDAAFQREGKARPAGAGVEWWTQAWSLFTRQVGMWIGVIVVTFVVIIVASLIPVLGQLVVLLFGPVIAGGLMLGAREVDRGGELNFGHIFAGFSNQMGQLVLVGVIYLAGTVIAAVVIGLVAGVGIGTLLMGSPGGPDPATVGIAGATGVLLAVLVGLALMLPLYMAMWFAPALVVFHELDAVDAMKA
ncbi:MAG TPA: BPSS1780 family membrane protein, partial [Burkholderiales bacterium]|nr:BPSS1780 family membrane protein [Burkholderiales bacterium]